MARPLIVGEAPARTTVGAPAFTGPAGRRIAALAGVDDLRDAFDAVNLLDRWPGRQGKGAAFPPAQGRDAARALLERVGRRRPLVLAGRRVAAAFGLRALPYLERGDLAGRPVWVLPHPSGVCRWWNDPANRDRAAALLRALAG
jgi:uracil-DNA glycosylase